jgi:hypothetical protein
LSRHAPWAPAGGEKREPLEQFLETMAWVFEQMTTYTAQADAQESGN